MKAKNIAGKVVYERILKSKFRLLIELKIPKNQTGCRHGRATDAWMLCQHHQLESPELIAERRSVPFETENTHSSKEYCTILLR